MRGAPGTEGCLEPCSGKPEDGRCARRAAFARPSAAGKPRSADRPPARQGDMGRPGRGAPSHLGGRLPPGELSRMTDENEANKALIRAHYQATTNDFDPAAIDRQVGEDFYDHTAGQRMGPEGVKRHLMPLHAAFPHLNVTI